MARSRVSSSQILTTVEQILHYAGGPRRTLNQTSLEVPNSRLGGPKSVFELLNLRFGTLKSSFCGVLACWKLRRPPSAEISENPSTLILLTGRL